MPTKLESLRIALDDYNRRGEPALPSVLVAARELCPERFTVMLTGLPKETKDLYPASIPWSVVAPHAARAQYNHGQTLERLNERGGCSPNEIYCIVHHLKWGTHVSADTVLEWIKSVAEVKDGSGK